MADGPRSRAKKLHAFRLNEATAAQLDWLCAALAETRSNIITRAIAEAYAHYSTADRAENADQA